jgi:hypothetical protein
LAAGKMLKNQIVTGGMILQNHRWLPVSIFIVKITALGSLERVIGTILNISKEFQRSEQKIRVWF